MQVLDIESEDNERQVLEQGVDFVKKLTDCQLLELKKVTNPSKLLTNFINKKVSSFR